MAMKMDRKAAAEYLRANYGFGSAQLLRRLAAQGTGPAFYAPNSRVTYYDPAHLDFWAVKYLGPLKNAGDDDDE